MQWGSRDDAFLVFHPCVVRVLTSPSHFRDLGAEMKCLWTLRPPA